MLRYFYFSQQFHLRGNFVLVSLQKAFINQSANKTT